MKVLVLSCSTGEGHNSAAKAVKEALEVRGAECTLLDPICFKSEKRMRTVSSLYNNTISHAPLIFGAVYSIGALYDKTALPSPVAYANSRYAEKLAEYINENKFDAVVCSHLYAMQAMVAARKKYGVSIPVYTVMTDYTVIPFYKDIKCLDMHFAPTESLINTLVEKGFKREQIFASGIPVSPRFNIDISMNEAKAELGLPLEKKLIMILTGGAGCGKIVKLCKAMDKEFDDGHIFAVFSGKNEELKKRLEKKFSDNTKIRVIGFTANVNKFMKAADVVLSKPGGLSSTEIAVANRPFVHLKEIPGCETKNIKYFLKNGMSASGRSIGEAVKSTRYLLENSGISEKMLKNQKEIIPQKASEYIAEKIMEFKR